VSNANFSLRRVLDEFDEKIGTKRGLYIGGAIALALLIVFAAFRMGVSRGRQLAERDVLDTLAALNTPPPTSTNLAIVAADGNQSAAETSAAPTATGTSTQTPTVTPTPTITSTPSPTATPASNADWAEQYRARAAEGLNTLSALEFSRDRAVALLRGLAQEHGLVFVPVSYSEIATDPWAALVVPRTPNDETLPLLFWQDPHDANRIYGQSLLPQLQQFAPDVSQFDHFRSGLRDSVLRVDRQGRFQLLLAEQPGVWSDLSAYVLAQPALTAEFDLAWWSLADSHWSIAADSTYELVDTESALMPNMVITGSLTTGDSLRSQLDAPTLFAEQFPFARQQANTTWTPRFAFAVDRTIDAQLDGYRLLRGTLIPTPLTLFQRLLLLLQESDLSDASGYVTRLDLLQQAYDLELDQPATWMGVYLDADGAPIYDGRISERLRFFDNADRNRTFDAVFERDADGNYRLAALLAVLDVYDSAEYVTPVAPTGAASTRTAADGMRTTPTATSTPGAILAATRPPAQTTTLRDAIVLTDGVAITTGQTVTSAVAPVLAPTVTATPTPTALPTATPTATATETPTETPLPTATPTPAGLPSIVPDIPDEQAGLVTGSVVSSPSNLRGGPNTEYVVLAQLTAGTPVGYFGITEAGDWLLLRVNDPTSDDNGVVGWMALNLLRWDSDIAVLPRFRADGTPVEPFTPTPPPPPTATPQPGAPTATPVPTFPPTPVISQPDAASPLQGAAPPPPDAEEFTITVTGEQIPADPLQPLSATTVDGRAVQIDVQTAAVQIWSGLFGADPAKWVDAPAELLWPDAQAYVTTPADAADSETVTASRIRIVAAPVRERARPVSFDILADAVDRETIMALLGSNEQPGIHMLESLGTVQQLLLAERSARWISDDVRAGLLLRSPEFSTGVNSFTWMRTDGSGLLVLAQPFHNINGVVGDGFGNLWWIETPQVNLNSWQLWRYDGASARITLQMQASGSLFRAVDGSADAPLAPVLVATLPRTVADVTTFLIDTVDAASQELHTGLFRLTVSDAPAADVASLENDAEVVQALELLLPADAYRGPLRISPARTHLAYFVYDPAHPSLTSGFITPANRLMLLDLTTEEGASQILYETETAFEFLAPNLAWRDTERLVLARSRFAEEDVFGLDRFGLVEVHLGASATDDGAAATGSAAHGLPETNTYLFPEGQMLRDFASCRLDEFTLLVMDGAEGQLQLARWAGGTGRPRPLFGLPTSLSRTLVCWRAPTPQQ